MISPTEYKYDTSIDSYMLFNNDSFIAGSSEVAICYSYNELDAPKANILMHGLPDEVSRFYKNLESMRSSLFEDEESDVFYFSGIIPVDHLNLLINDPEYLGKYHLILQQQKFTER